MSQTVIDWSQAYATWVAGDGLALSTFTINPATISPTAHDWANLVASYIAADYDLTHRGTACSVKARSANSTGVIADVQLTEGQVLGRSSNVLGSFSLASLGAVTVLARSVTPQSVTESGQPSLTDLLAYTIPANTLSAGRIIRVRMGGTYLNNSAGTRVTTWQIALPGGTLYQASTAALAANAQASSWDLEFYLACESSTLVHLRGWLKLSSSVAPTTGVGELTAPTGIRINATFGTVAAGVTVSALTSNRLLSVNFQHPANTATQTLVRTHYSVELLP